MQLVGLEGISEALVPQTHHTVLTTGDKSLQEREADVFIKKVKGQDLGSTLIGMLITPLAILGGVHTLESFWVCGHVQL